MQPLALLVAVAVMATVTLLVIGISQIRGSGQGALSRRLEYLNRGETSRPSGVGDESLLRPKWRAQSWRWNGRAFPCG